MKYAYCWYVVLYLLGISVKGTHTHAHTFVIFSHLFNFFTFAVQLLIHLLCSFQKMQTNDKVCPRKILSDHYSKKCILTYNCTLKGDNYVFCNVIILVTAWY